MEEECEKLNDHIIENQKNMKIVFDKEARPGKFIKDDLVLLWDKRHEPKGMHHKFDSLWKGPFRIVQLNLNNSFILAYPSKEILPFYYNGKDPKLYQIHN